MNVTLIFQLIAGASVLLLLTALFSLYRNPVLEIYLSSWGLC